MSENHIQISTVMTEAVVLDEAFPTMKERFVAKMKGIDVAMNNFRKVLQNQDRGGSKTLVDPLKDLLSNSPLVEGEGADRKLKLLFDVTHFHPSEVKVDMIKNKLTVSATHEEKTDSTIISRQYNREFFFPLRVNPKTVTSFLSKDGVLIVEAPVPT